MQTMARQCCFAPGLTLPRNVRITKSTCPRHRPTTGIRPKATATPTWQTAGATPSPLPADDADTPSDPVETFQITSTESSTRLDKVLAQRFPTVSRTYLQTLLETDNVYLNGETGASKKHKACTGDKIRIHFKPPQRSLPITPEPLPLTILYEDEHLLAIDKPAGMVVHPGPGNWAGTLVHGLTYHYREIRAMGGLRPGIVHRLDKGTSGVIVVARTEAAHRGLMELFARREVGKEYMAVTVGNPAGTGCISRTICEPIGRCPNDRLKMAVVAEEAGGKPALSRVWVEGVDGRGLLHVVRVEIETGRTHQIRVHLRHVRAPVLGDGLYGAGDVNRRFGTVASRPMLHAGKIWFRHPVTGGEVLVQSRLEGDMRGLVERNVMPGFGERFPEW